MPDPTPASSTTTAPAASGPKRPKANEVRPAIREALPPILKRHFKDHALEAAFPMPGSGREKVLIRAFGLTTPLVLRVYGVGERPALENAICVSRVLEGEAPTYQVQGFDEVGEHGFLYTLAPMLWGVDAQSLLDAEAIGHEDVRLLAIALGGAAAAMHGVKVEGFGEPRLPAEQRPDRLSAAVLAEIEDRIRGREARFDVAAGAFARMAAVANPIFDLIDEGAPASGAALGTLCHGRLDMSSLVVMRDEGRYRLVGLCRLSQARYLDPAYDLAWLESKVFPFVPALKDPFYRAYSARLPLPRNLKERLELYQALIEIEQATAARPG